MISNFEVSLPGKATRAASLWVAHSPDYCLHFACLPFWLISMAPKYKLAILSTPHNEAKYKEGPWAVVMKSEHYSAIERPQCEANQSENYSFSSP